MTKFPIKIKRKRGTSDWVSFEPSLSSDKKTFILRVESSKGLNFYICLVEVFNYAREEMKKYVAFDESKPQ